MLGVILCGGQSTRMGSDKGMIALQSATWAEAAAGKMAELQLPVLISVNEDQFNTYSNVFPVKQLVKDDTGIDVRGPLRGVLSVHKQYPGDDLFILACDMPLMQTNILQLLLGFSLEHTAAAHVFANDGVAEPLCGIYSAAGLAAIDLLQKTNRLERHSMKHVLEILQAATLPLTADQKKYFSNINTHAALNGL